MARALFIEAKMTLPTALQDREYQKFIDIAPNETAVRVSGTNFSGSFSLSGLSVAGRISVVTINSTTWTALPTTPLANRNAILIQNQTSVQAKLNYDPSAIGYVGIWINANGEAYRDIKDNIIIYAKCASGTIDLVIEELS